MKKLFTLFVLWLLTYSCFAQQTSTYDELMKKSRQNRTISTIMVATGPVIAAGGVGTLIYGLIENEIADPDYFIDANGNYYEVPAKRHTTEIVVGAIGTVVGLGVALTSIVFSNKASDYKRQARKLKIKSSADRLSIPGFKDSYVNNRTTQFKFSLMIPLGR